MNLESNFSKITGIFEKVFKIMIDFAENEIFGIKGGQNFGQVWYKNESTFPAAQAYLNYT